MEHTNQIPSGLLPNEDIAIVAAGGYILAFLSDEIGFLDVGVGVAVPGESRLVIKGTLLSNGFPRRQVPSLCTEAVLTSCRVHVGEKGEEINSEAPIHHMPMIN